jgi:hypothetical protein
MLSLLIICKSALPPAKAEPLAALKAPLHPKPDFYPGLYVVMPEHVHLLLSELQRDTGIPTSRKKRETWGTCA